MIYYIMLLHSHSLVITNKGQQVNKIILINELINVFINELCLLMIDPL